MPTFHKVLPDYLGDAGEELMRHLYKDGYFGTDRPKTERGCVCAADTPKVRRLQTLFISSSMEKDFKKKEINADEKVINIHDKIS